MPQACASTALHAQRPPSRAHRAPSCTVFLSSISLNHTKKKTVPKSGSCFNDDEVYKRKSASPHSLSACNIRTPHLTSPTIPATRKRDTLLSPLEVRRGHGTEVGHARPAQAFPVGRPRPRVFGRNILPAWTNSPTALLQASPTLWVTVPISIAPHLPHPLSGCPSATPSRKSSLIS